MSRFIMVNRIRCLSCDDVIESKHRHDFVKCQCGNVFVEGGRSHLRRGFPGKGKPEDHFEELSEYHEEEAMEWKPSQASS